MPSSPESCPSCSTVRDTHRPMVGSIIFQTMNDAMNTEAPTATTPSSWM